MCKKNLVWLTVILACMAPTAFAQEDSLKILELEADIVVLKEQLQSVKSLSEQERPNAFNPSISVIGNIVGQYGFGVKKEQGFRNGVSVREIEIEFRGSVDPFADALVTIALENPLGISEDHDHDHGDKKPHKPHAQIDVEDAFITVKSWPGLGYAPGGIEVKLGRFAPAFGRINRIHAHNTNQINHPLAVMKFLGDEGFRSQGIGLSSSFGLTNKSALTLFLEGFMGATTPMQDEKAAEIPMGLFHGWWHQEFGEAHYIDLGASAMIGRQHEKTKTLLQLGGDVHYSYAPSGYGQDPMFIVGSEMYASTPQKSDLWPLGNFTWAQVRVMNATFVGARYDIAPKEHFEQGYEHSISGYLTYYTSEFLRLRLGYEHFMPSAKSLRGDNRIMLATMFVLGSHPVEPYFANR